jgi:hypothetical protein
MPSDALLCQPSEKENGHDGPKGKDESRKMKDKSYASA